ncbi:MAG: hypothetical protein WA946_09015 [Nitrospirota bacterium]
MACTEGKGEEKEQHKEGGSVAVSAIAEGSPTPGRHEILVQGGRAAPGMCGVGVKRGRELLKDMAKKKTKNKTNLPPAKATITQQKRDRVASILAVALGLLSIREGGSVLLGVTIPVYHVIPWLVWYNAAMGAVSVVAGVGMWMRSAWSISLSVNILAFHGIVFFGLVGMQQYGQEVAMISIFAMMFRTFTWIVICLLLKWKRQDQADD